MGHEVPLPSQAPTDCCQFRKRSLAGVYAYSGKIQGQAGGMARKIGAGARPNSCEI